MWSHRPLAARLRTGMPETVIVRLPNWLGDTVMAVPAIRALRGHPAGQRAHPAQDEPRVERRGDAAGDVPQVVEPLHELPPPGEDQGTSLDIAVTAEVLGRRVEGHVHAEIERPLQDRRSERAVHDVAVFGAVTRNGPAVLASSTVVSPLFTPPRPSRAVSRKCSESGLAFVPAKPT